MNKIEKFLDKLDILNDSIKFDIKAYKTIIISKTDYSKLIADLLRNEKYPPSFSKEYLIKEKKQSEIIVSFLNNNTIETLELIYSEFLKDYELFKKDMNDPINFIKIINEKISKNKELDKLVLIEQKRKYLIENKEMIDKNLEIIRKVLNKAINSYTTENDRFTVFIENLQKSKSLISTDIKDNIVNLGTIEDKEEEKVNIILKDIKINVKIGWSGLKEAILILNEQFLIFTNIRGEKIKGLRREELEMKKSTNKTILFHIKNKGILAYYLGFDKVLVEFPNEELKNKIEEYFY